MVERELLRPPHGTWARRQQATWSSDVYRAYVYEGITEIAWRSIMATIRRCGKVLQLDNELSHYGKEPEYSEASQAKFRIWLKEKYTNIDNLNRDWGDAFWSQTYQNFEQIRLPNQAEA